MSPSVRAIRFLGAVDIVSGAGALVAAGWLGDQLDLSTGVIRIVAAVMLLFGVDAVLLAAKPVMRPITMAVELLVAVLAVDVLVLRDPTGLGAALLLVTAAYGVVAALALRQPSALVTSAA